MGSYSIESVLRNDRYLVKKVGEHEGPQQTSSSADNMKPWVNYDDQDSDGETEEELEDGIDEIENS